MKDGRKSEPQEKAVRERRAQVRYEFMRNIQYVLSIATADEVFKGIIIDISDSGLGMYAFNRLHIGQEIMIKSGLDDTYRKGTVRWCRELGDNVYRAGLLFNDVAQASTAGLDIPPAR